MKVIAIAAVGKNGVIGNGSQLPWNIPEDMKFFRDSTRGQIVIMGRKTLDALGKPLPKRENALITRNKNWTPAYDSGEKIHIFSDVKSSIEYYRAHENDFSGKNIFIIGGAQIYEAAMEDCDEVWLTEIEAEFEGDIYFPFYRDGKFLRPEFKRAGSRPQHDLSSPFLYRFNQFRRIK